MASLSYDSPAVLRDFAARKGLGYPMLSDPDSRVIRAFGILNESMPRGTIAYGVPYPGTYILDAAGVVRAKFFEQNVTERYTTGEMLVRTFGPGEGRTGAVAETAHLKAAWSASDAGLFPGSRAALVVEIELKPGVHVYAPGVEGGYIAIDWKMADSRAWRAHPAAYPPAERLHLPAIGATVPVYTGRFRLARDITVAQEPQLAPLIGADRVLAVKGTLRYQACDDRECFPPETLPLQWTFHVQPLDTRRAPPPLRRKTPAR